MARLGLGKGMAALAVSAIVIGAGSAGAQRGQFRERFRAKMEERQAERKGNTSPATITAPGDYTYTLRHGGRERTYLVHVPRSYNPARPSALIIAMHGGGGSASYMADDAHYGLISKSEQAGFILAFPNGISPLPNGMLATFNAGSCCGQARDKGIDDVGFIREMVRRLQGQVKIDRSRVFATGMSNGAMMSYRLACEMPEVIKGIAAVAGTDNTIGCTPKSPVPILHIHALDDDHVLYNGGMGPAARNPDKEAVFNSVPATISKWVSANGAAKNAQRVLTVPGATCDLYSAGQGGAPVKLCVTQTGGHSWPGGGVVMRKTPSNAINANDVMWDFFQTLR